MRLKDSSVLPNFHPKLSVALFRLDERYREWGAELVITSGGEEDTRHGITSLHYADPCCAADIRIWERANVPNPKMQLKQLRADLNLVCAELEIPTNWFDLILESDHLHLEYQPKRRD